MAIIALVLSNAFFVCAEFALVRARRPRLEAMARGGDRLATLALRASSNTSRLLSASQLGITLSSLGLGWLLAGWFHGLPLGPSGPPVLWVRVAVALATVVYLHIVFGELIPRAAALAQPERLARLLAPPLRAFAWVMAPITAVVNASAQLFRRSGTPTEEASVHSPEELRLLVEQSQESGALLRQDADLLEGVFEFSEKNAREVMTPRTELVALPVDATLQETLDTLEESGLSRFPIYEDSIDNIVGVVLAKDLLPVLRRPPESFTLRDVMRPVHVIPGTREVEEVLADFKRLKEHLAVVLDEYGGTAGVVTMEDLLEEIVGEILDEYDEPGEPMPESRPGEILIPGETNIGELNERYGLSVADTDYTTIGGYVFGQLGRLPQVGDKVTAGGAIFTVRAMTGRRTELLSVELISTGAEDDAEAAAS